MMATQIRFAALVLIFAILPSHCFLAQESTKPCTDAAAQTADERKAMLARTHCEVLNCVQKFLYLSNMSQPSEMQEVVNAIRAIADIQRVQQIISSGVIIIEGTPEQVALGEKLATEIDRSRRKFGELGYRIDLKIQESEGDKKINSRLYSVVTEPHQSARVSIGKPAPVPPTTEAASDAKPPSSSSNSRSIEVRIIAESERTLELSVETEFSSETAREPSGAFPLLKSRMNVMVELDKPTVIGRIDDPDSDRSFTIELTGTRIKEKS
jgi:hypothetical protein